MPAFVCGGGKIDIEEVEEMLIDADNHVGAIYQKFDDQDAEIISYLSIADVSYEEWSEFYEYFKYYENDELINALVNAKVVTDSKLKSLSVIFKKEQLKQIQKKRNKVKIK